MDLRLVGVVKTRAEAAGRRSALVGMGPERVGDGNQSLQQVLQLALVPCAIRHHPYANLIRILRKLVDISIDRTNRWRRKPGRAQSSADGVPPVLRLDIDIEHETDGAVIRAANGVRHTGQELFESFAATAGVLGTLDFDWPLGRGHIDSVAQEQRRDGMQIVASFDAEGWSAGGRTHYRGSMSLLTICTSDAPVKGTLRANAGLIL